MEKIKFKNSGGKQLVGILHGPKEKTDKTVIIAHGFTSNKERERYKKIADKLNENNIALLRFDFGGSGESYDTEIDMDKQINDLQSAINFVKTLKFNKIGLIGESFGGLISLKIKDKDVKAQVLWAPVTHSKAPNYLERHPEKMKEFERKGFVIKIKEEKEFTINKKYIEDRLNVNQDELLKDVNLPILILHGDSDDIVPLEHSKKAEKKKSNIKLIIIKNADHDVGNNEEALELTSGWFKENL